MKGIEDGSYLRRIAVVVNRLVFAAVHVQLSFDDFATSDNRTPLSGDRIEATRPIGSITG